MALCGLGAFLDPTQFFRSYLLAYVFWLGLPLGWISAAETRRREPHLAGKLAGGEQILNIQAYCQKVAHFIYLEWVNRHQDDKHEPLETEDGLTPVLAFRDPDPLEEDEQALEEERIECQIRCLQELPDGSRELIKDYFAGEGRERIGRHNTPAYRGGSPTAGGRANGSTAEKARRAA